MIFLSIVKGREFTQLKIRNFFFNFFKNIYNKFDIIILILIFEKIERVLSYIISILLGLLFNLLNYIDKIIYKNKTLIESIKYNFFIIFLKINLKSVLMLIFLSLNNMFLIQYIIYYVINVCNLICNHNYSNSSKVVMSCLPVLLCVKLGQDTQVIDRLNSNTSMI